MSGGVKSKGARFRLNSFSFFWCSVREALAGFFLGCVRDDPTESVGRGYVV